ALADPSYAGIEAVATAQIAAAVVTAALLSPFIVALASRWQAKRGVSPEMEDAWTDGKQRSSAHEGEPSSAKQTFSSADDPQYDPGRQNDVGLSLRSNRSAPANARTRGRT